VCQNAKFISKLREIVIHLPVSQHAIRNWLLCSAERRIKAAYRAHLALNQSMADNPGWPWPWQHCTSNLCV